MAAASCFMIFGKDNTRLFSSISPRALKNAYDIELFVYCSLDIVDEKSAKSGEMYLGHLYSDQKYKSFGFITNTGVRMVLVLELNNMNLKDQEVRGIFKRFHAQYCNAISNPFYSLGTELKSKPGTSCRTQRGDELSVNEDADFIFVVASWSIRQMEEGFSGVVRLSNISDFIAPNLNCIIPLEKTIVKEEPLVAIRNKECDEKPKEKKAVIKVTLNDCLACNGCITSAETVLVEEQSLTRLLEGIAQHQLSVVTISPQTVCSIAVKRNISSSEAARLISAYFLGKGVHYVLDSSFGRLFSLEAAFEEFKSSSARPLLVSACPGFVCYAEKTHGKLLIPLLSKIRSPQAVQGALVKDYLARKFNIQPGSVYHASVMPCFDKKLEASRPDFLVQGTEVRETDCVISSAELDAALDENCCSQATCSSPGWLGDFGRGFVIGNDGGSSGGFAEHVTRRFIAAFGGEPKLSKVTKNVDQIEVFVENEVKLRVARVYGFRNIQNMVRKLKTGKCNYDYVEVMACPGGCANGGGQLRAETKVERDRLLEQVEQTYNQLDGNSTNEFSSVVEEWSSLNPNFRQLIYTDYHAVETNIGQTLQW